MTARYPNPAATVVLGYAMGDGVNIAFPSCQPGIGGKVILFMITVTPTTTVSDLMLTVEKRSTPSNPSFQCPLFTLCDAPAYTKLCVCGGQGVINGTIENCGCGEPSPTDDTSWGHIKSLYW